MINGFATLSYLRSHLLPKEVENDTDWDDDLARIGRGVAKQFDQYCGRRIARTTGHVEEFAAGTSSLILECSPVEQVTALKLVRQGDDEEDILELIATTQKRSGVVRLTGNIGHWRDLVEVTYDGGYWLDDQVDSLPSGAAALPDDLLDAWVIQCQAQARALDLFGSQAMKNEANPQPIALELVPTVKQVLDSYRRVT